MKTRIAINGFGRIGRNVVRAIYESGRTDIDIVAINDLGPVETNAHLMRWDSVHGKFPKTVEVDGDTIRIEGGDSFKVFSERDPKNLPWGDLGIDIVMECTGIFTARKRLPSTWKPAPSAFWSRPRPRAPTRPSSTASTMMC
jgi:glyceraldehyde 3-phosphate dehydrogenase